MLGRRKPSAALAALTSCCADAVSLKERSVLLAALVAGCAGVGAPVASAADVCPNAAIRAVQGAAHLPDCRAFEQTTPVDKGLGGVDTIQTVQSAILPGAVGFRSANPFPGSPTAVATGTYRAKRTAAGWTTSTFDLPQTNPDGQNVNPTKFLSADLTKSVSASLGAFTSDAVANQGNLYVRDLETGRERLVTSTSPFAPPFSSYRTLYATFTFAGNNPVLAANPALDHFLFESKDPELGGGVNPGVVNVFEWTNGQLRLVNRLPDGTPSSLDATAFGAGAQNQHPMSADGSKIFFAVPQNGSAGLAMYLRENGSTTTLISHSQRTGDDPTVPTPVLPQGASADGRYYFFASTPQLTDEPVSVGSAYNLYRYDTNDGSLRLIAAGDASASAIDLSYIGLGTFEEASYDGERAYFVSEAKLTPDAESGTNQLYIWDHGVTKRIANLHDDPKPRLVMSSDGRYAGFVTTGAPTGQGPSAACDGQPCAEAYRYDTVSEELRCVSCPSVGESKGHAQLGGIKNSPLDHLPASVLGDGTFFFSTPNARVSGDVNGKSDVYESDGATERLLSSGTDGQDALFRDASADGTDVYFQTKGRLVAQDRDSSLDLYTARRDGGLPAQNEPAKPTVECAADSCQGPATGSPAGPQVGSLTLSAAGNEPLTSRPSASVSASRTVTGMIVTVKVRVSGAGAISVSGASVGHARRAATKAGLYSLPVRLTAHARGLVTKRRSLKARLTMTYRPKAGSAISRSVTVTFKKPAAKRSASAKAGR